MTPAALDAMGRAAYEGAARSRGHEPSPPWDSLCSCDRAPIQDGVLAGLAALCLECLGRGCICCDMSGLRVTG